MSCISRIEEFSSAFTSSEAQIAAYIKSHMDTVLEQTASELADACGVSSATVIRFARTIGFSGYGDMKLDLARDIDTTSQREMDEMIHSNDSMSEIAKKYSGSLTRITHNTMGLIKPKDLDLTISLLRNAEVVHIYGVGASGLVAEDLQKKFVRINKRCTYYSDYNLGVSGAIHIRKKDVVLAISYSGQTKEVNIPAEFARKVGAPVIAITKCSKSKLTSLADVCLYLPNTENEVRIGALQSRTAQLFITDLLYMGVIREQLDSVGNWLEESRELIRKLKDD
jgi:DNA-binding MurR/RpiR family transcriptional regulator